VKSDPWHLLNSGLGHFDVNMATDEALLEAMPKLGRPVLRLYGWIEAAASFGYFQRYVDVEAMTSLRPLVRRPTAGGLVPHAADWTYSLAVPTTHPWYRLTAIQSYRRVHEWIRDAFELLNVNTVVAPQALKAQPGQCFAGFERFDLLWSGHKIAGAAQRRRRDGLLIQGSVQPPRDWPSKTAWEQAMCETAVVRQNISWTPLPQYPLLDSRVAALAQTKYSQTSYNQKR